MSNLKNESVKLASITIELGTKKLELTVDECKKLKEVLGELFGKEVIRETIINNRPNWWINPTYSPLTPWAPYYGVTSTMASSFSIQSMAVSGATITCNVEQDPAYFGGTHEQR